MLWGSNHYAQRLPVGTTLVWLKRNDAGFGSFLSDAELGWMNTGHGVYARRDLSMMAETLTRMHPTQKPIAAGDELGTFMLGSTVVIVMDAVAAEA